MLRGRDKTATAVFPGHNRFTVVLLLTFGVHLNVGASGRGACAKIAKHAYSSAL